MNPTPPTVIDPSRLPDHPAVRAWRALAKPDPARLERVRTATRSKPALYRMTFAGADAPAVFVKRSHREGLALERTVYEEILPRLSLLTPTFRGWFEDQDGSAWLFVDDVGGGGFSDDDPEHRALAAQWLGRLHREGARLAGAATLPQAGAPRYLGQLRAGRAEIRRHLGNPALSAADREVLDRVLAQQDVLESRWPAIERACRGLPVTLVHGDFQAKNLRVLAGDAGRLLCALDWEMAGWGVPAADLGNADGRGLSAAIDASVYRATVRGDGPDLDDVAIERLTILGRIFQGIAAVEWSSSTLQFEDPQYLLKPVSSMRLYERMIAATLERAAWWPG